MQANRRSFLATAAASALAPPPPAAAAAAVDFSSIRAEFPWNEKQLFMNPAGWHPMRKAAIATMHEYLEYKLHGPAEGRDRHASGHQDEARRGFAQLINAKPTEIAFVQSTLMGENIVNLALGIVPGGPWNVVTDEFHYESAIYMYRSMEKQGLDLRVVKMKDWRIDVNDIANVVDKKTRLVACSLVSFLNGVRADAKAISDLVHAHGGYLYTDVIQAAGAVPVDVKALGIDFCACSGYKFLMGDRGLGFLYVREDLQGRVAKRFQYGDRQFTNPQYHMFPHDPPGPRPCSWDQRTGAGSFYEVGNVANVVAAGHAENLRFINELGVERIQAHVKPLVEKLRKELPLLGYPGMTPDGTPTPISSFVVQDPKKLAAKMKRANIDVKVLWNQLRVSCSVYHNMADIDRFLNAAG
jgi:selenocysteine lyase/cysteine desulfurase